MALTTRELRWYAVGSISGGIGLASWNFMVFYYNQILGIPGSYIGLAALGVSVFDAITDPAAGAISDRTRSRLGRRHPYLIASTLPIAITFYLTWNPPAGLSMVALMGFLLSLHIINRLASTFYAVPYLALGAEISSDYEERTKIAAMRSVYSNIGRSVSSGVMLLVFLRATPEFENGQMNPDGYPLFGLVFSVVMFVVLAASAWNTRDWVPRLSTAAANTTRQVRDIFGDLLDALAYRSFRAILFGSVARHFAWGVSEVLGLYMVTYFWKVDTSILVVWGIGMFGGMFLGLWFWPKMAARFDKKPIMIIGDVSYLTFFCSPYLFKVIGFWPDHDSAFYIPLYVLTTGFLAHIGISASSALTGSMLGDITDLDEMERGRRREGVIFGAESFTWKALTGLGPLGAGLVIDFVGLTQGMAPEDAGPEIEISLGLAQGGVMTVFFAIAMLFTLRYDLNRRRHADILAVLDRRREDAID